MRAAMLFGRAFELALGAYFRREDPGDVLFREWSACKGQDLQFSDRDTWDRMLEQGIMLLTRFCQDDRIRISQPRRNLQIKFTRQVERNEFVAYVDAIGEIDGIHCLLEWKTSASRYPEEPVGLLALDPQLVCYSWITGISEVAQIVFVRKRLVEIQYLRTTITEGAAPAVRPSGRRHNPQNRVRRISASQRNPLPAESVHHLSVRWAVFGAAGNDRRQSGAASRSRKLWLA